MVAPPTTPRSFAVDVARVSAAFQDLARQMGAQFLDKQEIIRLMTISAIAGRSARTTAKFRSAYRRNLVNIILPVPAECDWAAN